MVAQEQVGEFIRQGTACDHGKTAGTCRDILKREDAVWIFGYIEGVEPTNNFGEQQIRPGVLWRNGSFGTQSGRGSRFAECMLTVSQTLRLQGRSVLDFVERSIRAARRADAAPSVLHP